MPYPVLKRYDSSRNNNSITYIKYKFKKKSDLIFLWYYIYCCIVCYD